MISCKTSRVETSKDQIVSIFEKEIELFITDDTIFLKEEYDNEFIKSFLKELPVSSSARSFKDEEIVKLLKPNEIDYLISQLNSVKLPLKKHLEGNDKIKFLKNLRGDSTRNGLEIAKQYTRNKMIFSSPVITSTEDYALIYVSKGMEDAMSSSINVYKNVEGKWIFYTQLFNAIE